MDTKTIALTLFVAAIMGSSGAVVYSLNTTTVDGEEEKTEVEDEYKVENYPPKLMIDEEITEIWDGNTVSIEGYIYDENLSTSWVTVSVLNENFAVIETMNLSVLPSGKWTSETSITGPGSFILQITAYDAEQQESEGKPVMLVISPPEENDVRLTFGWTPPVENETLGIVEGAVLHEFPETCSVKYQPSNQNSAVYIPGNFSEVDATYTLTIDTEEHSTKGILVAKCGMFEESEQSISVDLPLPPEPIGDNDQDGVLEDVDACPETPAGEPVYSTGCSDSETDDDGDGVVNADDLCPNTSTGASVDGDGCADAQKDTDSDGFSDDVDACPGTPAGEQVDAFGCSESQKDDDNDGVSNDIDTCPNTPSGETVNEVGCSESQIGPQGPLKILALHGGGQTANGLRSMQGMQDLMASLSDYEFVFASTPESNNVWIRDPPGGKGQPTTDRGWADTSISYLDQIVDQQGPFHAILGYSQGAAMIPVYLANTDNTFEKVMMYNGYLPTTHEGLIDTIDEAAPFSTPAMVFSGENDDGFKDMAPALAQKFSDCAQVHSPSAGHHPPYQSDSKYNQILNWITSD